MTPEGGIIMSITLREIYLLASRAWIEVYGIDESDRETLSPICGHSDPHWASWYVNHLDARVCRIAPVSRSGIPVLRIYIEINKENIENDH